MRASFAILAATDLLLLAVTAVLGWMLGGTSSDGTDRAALFARHFVLGLAALLFTCFVHVLAFTYFVVFTRMARDAVAARRIDAAAALAFENLKRRSMRCLLLGVGTMLLTGVSGALASVPSGLAAPWHLAAAMLALAANGMALTAQGGLIGENVELTDRHYPRGGATAERAESAQG